MDLEEWIVKEPVRGLSNDEFDGMLNRDTHSWFDFPNLPCPHRNLWLNER
jgi:hypothetical protein